MSLDRGSVCTLSALCLHSTPQPQADVAAYLLNYMAHSGGYSQERRNCQTFAADLFALLSGRRGVEPYRQSQRLLYRERVADFQYEPDDDDGADPHSLTSLTPG